MRGFLEAGAVDGQDENRGECSVKKRQIQPETVTSCARVGSMPRQEDAATGRAGG